MSQALVRRRLACCATAASAVRAFGACGFVAAFQPTQTLRQHAGAGGGGSGSDGKDGASGNDKLRHTPPASSTSTSTSSGPGDDQEISNDDRAREWGNTGGFRYQYNEYNVPITTRPLNSHPNYAPGGIPKPPPPSAPPPSAPHGGDDVYAGGGGDVAPPHDSFVFTGNITGGTEHHEASALLKAIDKEIDDETLRIDKEPPTMPTDWEVEHVEGTSVFTMRRRAWTHSERLCVAPPPSHPLLRGSADPEPEPPAAPATDDAAAKAASKESSCSADSDDAEATEPTTPLDPKRARSIPKPTPPLEDHIVVCQLTCRDPSLDPECDIRGEHFPFTLQVHTNGLVVECQMDVVEGEVIVEKTRVFENKALAADGTAVGKFDRSMQFPGPSLDEAEEELLDGLQTWLAERNIDDQFGEFIAQYSTWIEQLEYERWLKELRRFVAA